MNGLVSHIVSTEDQLSIRLTSRSFNDSYQVFQLERDFLSRHPAESVTRNLKLKWLWRPCYSWCCSWPCQRVWNRPSLKPSQILQIKVSHTFSFELIESSYFNISLWKLPVVSVKPRENKEENFKSRISKDNEDRLLLGETPVSKIFLNTIVVISGILTIWNFAAARQSDALQKFLVTELVDEWNTELESLHSKIDQVHRSLQQVNCQLEFVYPRTKGISQECLQFSNPNRVQVHPSHGVADMSTKSIRNKNTNYSGEKVLYDGPIPQFNAKTDSSRIDE